MFLQKNITLVEHTTEKNDKGENFIRNHEKKNQNFSFQKLRKEIDRPQYGIKCWSVYRFT